MDAEEKVLSVEELFDQATEDISGFLWAVEAWEEPPEEYSKDYLLMLILGGRARGARALKLLRGPIPKDYMDYRTKLELMYEKAERIRKTSLSFKELPTEIAKALGGRIQYLCRQVESIRRLVEDIYLLAEDPESPDSEMVAEVREVAHDFLLHFQDLVIIKEQLQELGIVAEKFYQDWEALESLFRSRFNYFSIVADLLQRMKVREYGEGYWWFDDLPDLAKIVFEWDEARLESLGRVFRVGRISRAGTCPGDEMVIGAALGELAPTEAAQIRQHLIECHSCLDLFLNVRFADAEAMELGASSSQLLQKQVEEVAGKAILGFLVLALVRASRHVTLRGKQAAWAGPGEASCKELEYTGPNVMELGITCDPSGKVFLPWVPDTDEFRALRQFVNGVQEFYSAGVKVSSKGKVEFLETRKQPRPEKVRCDGTRKIVFLIGTEEKKVASALHKISELLRMPSTCLENEEFTLELPEDVVVLIYTVEQGI